VDKCGQEFRNQWKVLTDCKNEDELEVPKISKALPVIKWTEAFKDYLNQVIGARSILLACVICAEPVVLAAAPPLANGEPHLIEHGSVAAEVIARASHDHALFRDDNPAVYYKLQEATRHSICSFNQTFSSCKEWSWCMACTNQSICRKRQVGSGNKEAGTTSAHMNLESAKQFLP
jgi:hypothetical protein